MRQKPTAPIIVFATIACLGLGLMLGVLAVRYHAGAPLWPVAQGGVVPAAAPIRDPLAVGTVGTFPSGALVWVDDLEMRAYLRAEANRDGRATSRALELFQTYEIPPGTRAHITNRRADAIQVEIVDGPLKSRRGWCPWTEAFAPGA